MKQEEINKKARELGIDPYGMNKKEHIRTIQINEGNFPCFATAEDDCDQTACLWRPDCLAKK
jgi:hypothetical protein